MLLFRTRDGERLLADLVISIGRTSKGSILLARGTADEREGWFIIRDDALGVTVLTKLDELSEDLEKEIARYIVCQLCGERIPAELLEEHLIEEHDVTCAEMLEFLKGKR